MIEDTNDELAKFHRMFFDADEASRDERLEGEKARDYFDGKQYTAEELEILAQRKQPPTTLNRVARKVNHLLGLEVDRRTDPKAYPRTDKDEKVAELATDGLRYVEQSAKMDQVFSAIHEEMIVEGYGGCELVVYEEEENGQPVKQIGLVHWQWGRLFYDPHSVKLDFTDAMYLGGVEWMDYEKAVLFFPGKEGMLGAAAMQPASGSTVDDYEDEPEKKAWVTRGARKRVRIVHMYYQKDGEWYLVQFTGGGILYNEMVEFVDDKGKTYCPLRLQSAYIDRDGDRYGEVRNMISPQDMINKTHSKIQHMVSTRQILAEDGAISEEHGGIDEARQQLAKPDGVIVKTPGLEFEILETADMVQGQAVLLQEFKTEMDLIGPNASMQGKGPQSQSGRALIAQTEGGMREFNPVADRFNSMKEDVYRNVWYLIKQYWDYPKWVRVTDDEQKPKLIGLNMPMTKLEAVQERIREETNDERKVEQTTQEIISNPVYAQMAQEPANEVRNDVSKINVDIIIETAPDMVTMQAEQFAQLAQMAPALAQAGQPIPAKVLIKASAFKNKEELLKDLEGDSVEDMTPQEQEAAQQQQALKQQQVQLEISKAEADIEKTKSEAARNYAMANKPDDSGLNMDIEEAKVEANYQLQQQKAASADDLKRLEIAAKAEIEALKIQSQQSPLNSIQELNNLSENLSQ